MILSIFAVLIVADLICHDYWYESHALMYVSKDGNADESNYTIAKRTILVIELVVLIYFIAIYVLHLIGYGLLFLKNKRSFASFILCLDNIVFNVYMEKNQEYRISLFGTKLLLSLILF